MKSTYNTLSDEQVSNLIQKIVRKSVNEMNIDSIDSAAYLLTEYFFDILDDKYTLSGMTNLQAETFCNEIYSYTEDFLVQYLAE